MPWEMTSVPHHVACKLRKWTGKLKNKQTKYNCYLFIYLWQIFQTFIYLCSPYYDSSWVSKTMHGGTAPFTLLISKCSIVAAIT